jgi:LysR family glycine cleavage system transcriptional activator
VSEVSVSTRFTSSEFWWHHALSFSQRLSMAKRPPLNAVYVFCEAARALSFTAAAESLCVTPGAVSRQIQALEAHVRRALFDRKPAGLQLTAHGRQLLERVAPNMAAIELEIERVRTASRKAVVQVDVSVTFAAHWLIPRLGTFAEEHPGIQVDVLTVDGPIDLTRSSDVFVRRDVEELRGFPAVAFMDELSVVVYAPKLLKGRTSFGKALLRGVPRIGSRTRPDLWRQYCAHHRLDEAEHRPTHEFGNTVMAIQAATAGLGVMVVPEMFVRPMLADGALRALPNGTVKTGSYSVATQATRRSRSVATFIEWMTRAD